MRLAETGRDVRVVARDLPSETTSAVAGAIWYPYRIQPYERVGGWAGASLARFTELADDPGTGVVLRHGTELLRERTPDPWWAPLVPGLRRVERPRPPYVDGWSFRTPIVEMPRYLRWLEARVAALGVTVTRSDLAELPEDAVVVNCAGLGAGALVGDAMVHPVRGQVVVVSQVGVDEWWLDGGGLTYVVPRAQEIVLGGTDTEYDDNVTVDPGVASAIIDRAAALVPPLAEATVLAHRVGLRPARPEVRLEVEVRSARQYVVHCYGHGGAGVTVSWGCADEVLALLDQVEEDRR